MRAVVVVLLISTACAKEAPHPETEKAPPASSSPAPSAVDERTVVITLQRALADAKAREDDQALRDVVAQAEKAQQQHPRNRQLQHVLGAALLDVGEAKRALPIALALAESDDKDPIAFGLLSDARLATKDVDGAVAALERMMELAPGLPAYSRAARLRYVTGDVDGSLEMWRIAFQAGHKSEPLGLAYTATEAGDVFFFGKGDVEQAQRSYEVALAALPDFPAAKDGLARVAECRGDDVKQCKALRSN